MLSLRFKRVAAGSCSSFSLLYSIPLNEYFTFKKILSTLNGNFGLCLAFGYKATMSFLLSIYFVNINIDFWGYVFMSVIDTG